MADLRLEPASLYPHERGSVLVPLPLLPLPARVEAEGEVWERKRELHVTAASTRALARRLNAARGLATGEAEDRAWQAIAGALDGLRAGTVTIRRDIRLVRRDEQRTLIAMAEVEGLERLHERIGAALGLEPEPPPAHVTMYTRPAGAAIGLHTARDLERLGRRLDPPPFSWP